MSCQTESGQSTNAGCGDVHSEETQPQSNDSSKSGETCTLPEKLWESNSGPWGNCDVGANAKWRSVSIRKLLNQVAEVLQDDKACQADSPAVKELEDVLKAIEKEYAGISKLAEDYRSAYEKELSLKGSRDHLNKTWDDLLEKIKSKCDKSCNWQYTVDCIEDNYSAREKDLKNKLEIALCLEIEHTHKGDLARAKEEQEAVAKDFSDLKEKKGQVESWVKELDVLLEDLKKLAPDLSGSEASKPKCKSLDDQTCSEAYAIAKEFYRLAALSLEESKSSSRNVASSNADTADTKDGKIISPDEYEEKLIKALRYWIQAAYVTYVLYREHLKAQAAYTAAKEAYQSFRDSRRKNFLEEVSYSKAECDHELRECIQKKHSPTKEASKANCPPTSMPEKEEQVSQVVGR